MNLYQKLHDIQTKVIGLGKDAKSNSYGYVSGSKVLEHLKPLMNQHGLILKQEVVSIENVRQDYLTSYDKPKNEILSKVMMKFTWIDTESGEKDENSFGANGLNAWDKGVGSALTYAERYFLLKYFHIATDEDDIDNPDSKKEDKQIEPPKQASKPSSPAKPTTPPPAQQSAVKASNGSAVTNEQVTALRGIVTKMKPSPEKQQFIDAVKESKINSEHAADIIAQRAKLNDADFLAHIKSLFNALEK